MDRMRSAFTNLPWVVSQSSLEAGGGVGLGSMGIGLLYRGPQPAWNVDRTVGLVMAGEFSGARPFADSPTDEATALALYKRYGEPFARNLVGFETNTNGKTTSLITYEMMPREIVD
jgi:hypothetical protein